jgi:hypothetical protein
MSRIHRANSCHARQRNSRGYRCQTYRNLGATRTCQGIDLNLLNSLPIGGRLHAVSRTLKGRDERRHCGIETSPKSPLPDRSTIVRKRDFWSR